MNVGKGIAGGSGKIITKQQYRLQHLILFFQTFCIDSKISSHYLKFYNNIRIVNV